MYTRPTLLTVECVQQCTAVWQVTFAYIGSGIGMPVALCPWLCSLGWVEGKLTL